MTKCFISHSWRDGGHHFARRLAEALRARAMDVWLDEMDLLSAHQMKQRIVDDFDLFLFVLSPASVTSKSCAVELDEALRARDESGLQILPLLFRECEIPAKLRSLLYADFRDQAHFDESFDGLVAGIEAASAIRELVAMLNDGDARSRLEAAQHLGELRNPFTVPILTRRLSNESDPAVRYWAAFALGQIGTAEAVRIMTEAKKEETHALALLGIRDGLREAGFAAMTRQEAIALARQAFGKRPDLPPGKEYVRRLRPIWRSLLKKRNI